VVFSPLYPTSLHLDPIITHISPHVKGLHSSSYNVYNLECIGILRLFSPPPLHFSDKSRQDSVFIHHPQKRLPEIMQKSQAKAAKTPASPPHAPPSGGFWMKFSSRGLQGSDQNRKNAPSLPPRRMLTERVGKEREKRAVQVSLSLRTRKNRDLSAFPSKGMRG
jgi:hypothetical protein